MSAENRQLTEIALHVLVAWVQRRKPLQADVELLRHAFPALAVLMAVE